MPLQGDVPERHWLCQARLAAPRQLETGDHQPRERLGKLLGAVRREGTLRQAQRNPSVAHGAIDAVLGPQPDAGTLERGKRDQLRSEALAYELGIRVGAVLLLVIVADEPSSLELGQ